MKTILLFLLLVVTGAGRAEILFEGYMSTAERNLFVLSLDKSETSGWLAVGQSFCGFTLQTFDSKTEELTVEKDGERKVLRLVTGRVVAIKDEPGKTLPEPIWIILSDGKRIVVGDDVEMIAALKIKLADVAHKDPDVQATLSAVENERPGVVIRALDLVRQSGIRHISVQSRSRKRPNQPPEPTAMSVTPPAAQESRQP